MPSLLLIVNYNLGDTLNFNHKQVPLASMAYWQSLPCLAALLSFVGILAFDQATLEAESRERTLEEVCHAISSSSN